MKSRNNHATNIQDIVEKHYDEMFDELMEIIGDDLYDLVVEVITTQGTQVKISFKERDDRLRIIEENREYN